jgi:hypothetical protein
MDSAEIAKEIEQVEKITNSNTDTKDVLGAATKGIWEIALQLARIAEDLCKH